MMKINVEHWWVIIGHHIRHCRYCITEIVGTVKWHVTVTYAHWNEIKNKVKLILGHTQFRELLKLWKVVFCQPPHMTNLTSSVFFFFAEEKWETISISWLLVVSQDGAGTKTRSGTRARALTEFSFGQMRSKHDGRHHFSLRQIYFSHG